MFYFHTQTILPPDSQQVMRQKLTEHDSFQKPILAVEPKRSSLNKITWNEKRYWSSKPHLFLIFIFLNMRTRSMQIIILFFLP